MNLWPGPVYLLAMRRLILFAALFVGLFSGLYGHPLTRSAKPWRARDKAVVVPFLGAHFFGRPGIEAGLAHPFDFGTVISRSCYNCPVIHAWHGRTSFSAELYPGHRMVVVPKLAIDAWMNKPEWICAGAGFLYVYEFASGKAKPVLRPEIGLQTKMPKTGKWTGRRPLLCTIRLKLGLGYNYSFGNEQEGLAPWQISLVLYRSEHPRVRPDFSDKTICRKDGV